MQNLRAYLFYVKKISAVVLKNKTLSITNFKGYILPLSVLFFMVMMLLFPMYYLDSTAKGLTLFATSILPALFPFMFLSTLLSKSGFVSEISRIFGKSVKKILGGHELGAYVLFSALVCGYPTGAAVSYELYNEGHISSDDVKRLVPYTSLAGPIFIIGTLGSAVFDNQLVGIVILLSHYFATFVNGLIWKIIYKKHSGDETRRLVLSNTASKSADNVIGESVANSALSMLTVGGYIVLAGLVADTFALIPNFELLPDYVRAFIYGCIEMTRGAILSSSFNEICIAVASSSFFVTFGGISVLLQSFHFLSKCGCKFKEVFLPKISAGILAFCFALIFSLLFFNYLA